MFHSRKSSSPRSPILHNSFRKRGNERELSDPKSKMGKLPDSLGSSSRASPQLPNASSSIADSHILHLLPDSTASSSPSKPTSPNTFRCAICRDLDSPCSMAWLDLKKSAASGCQACQVLVTGVNAYFHAEFIGLRHGGDNIDQATAESLLRIHVHLSRGAMKVGIGWADKSGLFDQCEIYTEVGHQQSPWRGLGPARTVAKDTHESFNVLHGWIHDCMLNHPGCNSNFGTLPLRVLDVGKPGNQQTFLHTPREQPDFYAALSHCWGTTSLLRTTKSNIDIHKKHIPWKDLSETFRNAIVTTQNLGIRYLWIDSLCILQDDSRDWEEQSAQMANIYAHAQVVLAATDAEDGSKGFLSRDPNWLTKGPFTMADNGDTYSFYVRSVRRHFSFRLQYSGAQLEHALFKRAWAFQEELLASRIVHFTKSELIWECKTIIACECMDLDSFDPKSAKLLYHKSLVPTARVEDKFSNWQRIVTSYMGKQISFEKDRIPALAGLAAQMQAVGAGQYLAGLWRENLILDLLWKCYLRKRASPYKCPTWAWASIEGALTVSYHLTQKNGMHYVEEVRARVIDVQWETFGPELSSSVRKGSLTIAAPLIQVEIHPREKRNGYQRYPGEFEIRYNGMVAPVIVDLLDETRTEQIFCILIGNARVHSHLVIHGIILYKTAHQRFERIGSMMPRGGDFDHGFPSWTLHPDLWFKGIEDSTITIL